MRQIPYRIARLDELERIGVDGGEEFSLHWLPVRATLGIRAFGTNAYVADAAGDHVVEPHTETGSDHEELYFVARGRATFTLAGDTVDAPAGTYVFLPDPDVPREAVAEESGTTVLSFGAPLGRGYEVADWEVRFRASALRTSDPAAARALLDGALDDHPKSGGVRYELACLEALAGNADAALRRLGEAVHLRRETASWAREDEDLASLREDPRFGDLTRPGS